MNVLISYFIDEPFGKNEECAQFGIDDVTTHFILSDITVPEQKYTFSFWIKSDTNGAINVKGQEIQTSEEWTRHVIKYTANSVDLIIQFMNEGTYYIYKPKLEEGDKATTWTPANEDVEESVENVQENIDTTNERVTTTESLIQQLSDSISMLVTDGNGTSLMTQTESGWTFSTQKIQDDINNTSNALNDLVNEVGNTDAVLSVLQQAVEDIETKTDYVNISTYTYTNDDGETVTEPCIELGESENEYKVLITNTQILFKVGSAVPTRINVDGLVTENITVENQLKQTHVSVDGYFIWSVRSNGNYGLQWKGGKR